MGADPAARAGPRALILWGALIAAVGLCWTMLADDLYGITSASRGLDSASG